MSLFDVCRLCSSKNNLVWVFDRKNKTIHKMEELILITTGVEVKEKDMISQKICDKCTELTITIFDFKQRCMENDKRLKDMCIQLLKATDMKMPNTDVIVKQEEDDPKQEPVKPRYEVHPTIADLFTTYPGIKLPSPCLKQNVAPFVCMPLDEVEDYFKNNKLNFNEHIKYALQSKEVDNKESANFSFSNSTATSNFVMNAEIISNEKEDEDSGIIRPIKIKIFSKECVNKNENNSNASDKDLNINCNFRESISNIYEIPTNSRKVPDNIQLSRKRKFSDVDKSPVTENAKELPLSYIEKSFSLHICDICNSVQYNAKDLKKHQNKHLHCQFCKTKFLTLDSKWLHLDNACIIKKTIENLPSIEVQKIEYNVDIRRKYPEAFGDFPALDNEATTNNNSKCHKSLETAESSSSTSITNSGTSRKSIEKHITAENTIEIIDISSDEDDDVIPIIEPVSTKTSMCNKVTASSRQDEVQVMTTSVPVVACDNVPAGSSEVIKITPHIRIKNSSALNNIDLETSDAEVLRKLLIGRIFAETCTQTYLPSDHSIWVNSYNMTAELKNLKEALRLGKIPVEIKPGPFNVSYKNNYKIHPTQAKKLHFWNHLQPTNIKINKKSIAVHNRKNMDIMKKYSRYNINSQIPNPTSKSRSIKNTLQSHCIPDDIVQTQSPSTLSSQAIRTIPSISPSCRNVLISNATVPQQKGYQHPSASKYPRNIADSTSLTYTHSSSNTVPPPHAYQHSLTYKPEEAIAARIHSSTSVSPSVANIAVPQQNFHRYSSTSNPQTITTAPIPTSVYTSVPVADMCALQQNVYQYSSASNFQKITTSAISTSRYTNSSVLGISVSQPNFYNYSSNSNHQQVATSAIPALTCTSSSVLNITVPQQDVYQYASTSNPQQIATSVIPALTYTKSSVLDISAPQQDVYQCTSTSNFQQVTASPVPTLTCTSSSVLDICSSQPNVYNYSSTSNHQQVATSTVPVLTCTSSSALDICASQPTVYNYSSTSNHQVATSAIPAVTCTSSSVTDITVPQQDVNQYASTSNSQQVTTSTVPALTCTSSSVLDICSSQSIALNYSSTSNHHQVTNLSVPAVTCTSSSALDICVSQPTVYNYSSTSNHQVATSAIPAETCTISSVSDITVPQQDVAQYPSNSQQVTTSTVPALTCTSSSVLDICSSQSIALNYSSTSNHQQDATSAIPALTCTSSSVSDITVPHQDVDQHHSTSNNQQVSTSTEPNLILTNSSVLNTSVPQQDVYQYSLISNPQQVAAATYMNSPLSNNTTPQQDIFQYSSTSESPKTIATTPVSSSTRSISSTPNVDVSQQDISHYSSTSKPLEVTTVLIPTSACTTPPVPQLDIYQHSSTSKPRETTTVPFPASTCTSSCVSDIPFPQQGFIRLKNMSELT